MNCELSAAKRLQNDPSKTVIQQMTRTAPSIGGNGRLETSEDKKKLSVMFWRNSFNSGSNWIGGLDEPLEEDSFRLDCESRSNRDNDGNGDSGSDGAILSESFVDSKPSEPSIGARRDCAESLSPRCTWRVCTHRFMGDFFQERHKLISDPNQKLDQLFFLDFLPFFL